MKDYCFDLNIGKREWLGEGEHLIFIGGHTFLNDLRPTKTTTRFRL